MQQFVFKDVIVNHPEEMPMQEAQEYVTEQLDVNPARKLVELSINIDGDDVLLSPHYDSIIRVRRITGYLSTIPRFNDAKRDEEKSRLKHVQ